VGGLLLDVVRAEFRGGAAGGSAPLSGAALGAAEAKAARTFEARPRSLARFEADALRRCHVTQFLRRAAFHGGAERALLHQLVHRNDDTVRRRVLRSARPLPLTRTRRRGASTGRAA